MHDFIRQYEAMSQLTRQMVEAARANDWDSLNTLERNLGTLRDQLIRIDRQPAALTEHERERKRELILRMLDDDREIRRHTELWMREARQMLSSWQVTRNLREAYGGSGPH